jgi:hypothetical protein
MRPILVPLLAIACGLLAAPAADAAQDAAGCEAAKLKACATSSLAQLKCHALAAKKSIAVDPACLTKAETKFRIAFDRIDSRGGCATTGDSAVYEVEVDAFVADIVGENLCSPKIKAAGSAAQGLLKCWARATKKSEDVDTGCLDKADDKLAGAFTKADAKGCTPTGGATVVQGHVDSFVDQLVNSPAIILFESPDQLPGSLGNRATTSATCAAAAAAASLSCGTTVAMLSYTGDAIREFPTSYGLPTDLPIIANGQTIADNWADFLDGTWDTCLGSGCTPAGPTGAGFISNTTIWTGSNSDGTTRENCNDWTTDAANVDGGRPEFMSCYGQSEGFCSAGSTMSSPVAVSPCEYYYHFACFCY